MAEGYVDQKKTNMGLVLCWSPSELERSDGNPEISVSGVEGLDECSGFDNLCICHACILTQFKASDLATSTCQS